MAEEREKTCAELHDNVGSYMYSHSVAIGNGMHECYEKPKEGEGQPIKFSVSYAPTQDDAEESEEQSTQSAPTNNTSANESSQPSSTNEPPPECPNETFVNKTGERVIKSTLEHGTGKTKFQKRLFTGVEIGLAGWDRAHSQGIMTGTESPEAIYYAPEEVNRSWMKRIETFLRDLAAAKPKDESLCLMTVTSPHPLTLRLAEIQYEVTALKAGHSAKTVLIASIKVEDKKVNPIVTTEASYTGF
jgi:hypothetical protein